MRFSYRRFTYGPRLLVLLLLLVPSSAFAAAAKVWEGTVKVVSYDELTNITETIEGIVRFEARQSAGGAVQYHLAGGSYTWSASGATDGCTYEGGPTTFAFKEGEDTGILQVQANGLYSGGASSMQIAFEARVVAHCGEWVHEAPPYTWTLFNNVSVGGIDPTYRVQNDSLIAGSFHFVQDHYSATYEWHFLADPPALELEVELDHYEKWIPRGTPSEDVEGSAIAVTARLKSTDGAVLEDAMRFRFELLDVSREPGVAMNFPFPSLAKRTPDLRITRVLNEEGRDAEGQWATTREGKTATVEIASYDWGAYGTLRVTATLFNGREIVGYLAGDQTKQRIPVPKRASTSRIALAWLEAQGMAGNPDDYDGETKPEGDGHHGDGLSLYEEYRGFYQNGVHLYADPSRKDLFVFDEVGGPTKQAIALFMAATGLAVHPEVRPTEHWDRQINFNHGGGPHLVDQHGLRVVMVNEVRGYAIAAPMDPDGTPGTPGTIRAVEIPPNLMPGYPDGSGNTYAYARQYYVSTVAHELGHGTNIWHHGDTDAFGITWRVKRNLIGRYQRDDAGNLLLEEVTHGGGRSDIRVLTEGGNAPLVLKALQQHGEITIAQRGVEGGQHSGDENCFMRYDVSPAYASFTDPELRYWTGKGSERVGMTLCEHADGTGVNDPGHAPQSRYGMADRGRCKHQICVNDSHSH